MQALSGLDPGAVERLRGDVAALARPLDGGRLAIAVSGGADSMALLALAASAFPGQVCAATVDHGLRAESPAEAAMVARWCEGAGVPHEVLTVADAPERGDNLHDWARARRYRLLAEWAVDAGARLLATAHHADDQAETFLMRAARGSGVAGLAGIRAIDEIEVQRPIAGAMLAFDAWTIRLIRPLLGWRRADLRALAQCAGLPFVDDPSNADPRFERARVRALLNASPLLDGAQLARAAAYAAEAEATLRAVEQWLWRARRRPAREVEYPDDQVWLDMEGLPRELRRRLVRAAIAEVRTICGITRPAFTSAANVEPLLDALEAGKAATQAGVIARPAGTLWRFAEAPPRRSYGSAQSG